MTMSATLINSYVPDLLIDVKPVIIDDTRQTWSPKTDTPNPMILPHSFLESITPIFTIRHPIRMITSGVGIILHTNGRGLDEPAIELTRTYKWSRILCDYYRAFGVTPVVVDGDELARNTEDQVNKLCPLIGSDASKIQYNWEPKGRAGAYLKDLNESTGVIRDEVRTTSGWSCRFC